MSDIHRHSPELFDFSPAREESLEAAGPDGLEDCHTCHGEGEVKFNPSHSTPKDPQQEDYATCPDCKGDGTQIRASLELMARAMSLPSERGAA